MFKIKNIKLKNKVKNKYIKKILFIFLLLIFLLLTSIFIYLKNTPFYGFIKYGKKFWNFNAVILLQNNAELRPTGGFISAFAFLEIKNGKPNIYILDSYDIQEPSTPIKAPKYIEQVFEKDEKYNDFVIRDANFNPNFESSAKDIIKFLKFDERFSNKNFDMVASLNFEVIENIFAQIEKENKMSLFHEIQRYTKNIDLHSLEDLNNRKNILKEKMLILSQNLKINDVDYLIKIIEQSLNEKSIQLFFNDQELQNLAKSKNWTGELEKENLFSINIANLGAKKSNRYLDTNFFSEININNQGKLTEKLKINLNHLGYKNIFSDEGYYLIRIYRPKNTTTINKDFENSSENNYELFQKLVTIKPKENLEVKIEFELPKKIIEEEINLVKQSGMNTRFDIAFTTNSEGFFNIKGCDEKTNGDSVFLCKNKLNNDKKLKIKFFNDISSPFFEDGYFKNETELFVRFSENIGENYLNSNVFLICDNTDFFAKKIKQNNEEKRDFSIILDKNVKMENGFCKLFWKDITDEYENKDSLKLTIPRKIR